MTYVTDSALRHGFTEEEVRRAWDNVFEYVRIRHDKQPPHYMGLSSVGGRTVELIALSTGTDWVVFHAMTPPTRGFMAEYEKGRR